MTALFARIRDLERQVNRWRRRAYDMERSRDLWKARYRRVTRKGL